MKTPCPAVRRTNQTVGCVRCCPTPTRPANPTLPPLDTGICVYAVCRFSKKKKSITYFVLCFCFVSMYIDIYINVRQTSYIVSKFVIGCEVAMAQVCNSCFMFVSFFVNGVLQIFQQMWIFLWWWIIYCGLTTVTADFQFLLLIRNVKVSLSSSLRFFPPRWWLPPAGGGGV